MLRAQQGEPGRSIRRLGVNTTVGAVYLLLGIVGFFLTGTAANILALNVPDHFLHLASAVVLLGVGLGTERNVPRTAAV